MNGGLKRFLRAAFWRCGYKVYARRDVPAGNVLAHDVGQDVDPASVRTVFDVGANVGQAAAFLRENFPACALHSFEPAPKTFDELVRRVPASPRFHPHRLALGAAPGRARMYLQARSRFNSLAPAVNHPDPARGGGYADVTVDTLDGFCAREGIDRVDFLKIDAEGLDLDVLRGGRGLLERGAIRFVFVEVTFNPDAEDRYVPYAAVDAELRPRGFRLRAIYHQATNEKPHMAYADALFSRSAPA